MKIAKVVSVRDRDPAAPSGHEGRPEQCVARMTTLLRRYPAIDPDEKAALLRFLTAGPPEEVIDVTRLQGLEPRYQAIRRDHPREFGAGLHGWLPMIVLLVVAVAGLAWRLLG